jgi:hypothetical protein
METIDNIFQQQQIDHIDFIKIDVEGSEAEVLEGARNCLEEYCPNIWIEMNPEYLDAAIHSYNMLKKLGYVLDITESEIERLDSVKNVAAKSPKKK